MLQPIWHATAKFRGKCIFAFISPIFPSTFSSCMLLMWRGSTLYPFWVSLCALSFLFPLFAGTGIWPESWRRSVLYWLYLVIQEGICTFSPEPPVFSGSLQPAGEELGWQPASHSPTAQLSPWLVIALLLFGVQNGGCSNFKQQRLWNSCWPM